MSRDGTIFGGPSPPMEPLVEPDRRAFAVAGLRLVSEIEMPALEAFRWDSSEHPGGGPRCAARRGAWRAAGRPGRLTEIYRGQGWIGGRLRRVGLLADRDDFYLAVHPGGRYRIAVDGSELVLARSLRPSSPGAPSGGIDEEVLLGPCLVLALALHDVFCLHASAALFDGRVVAFPGDSGAGKSTLASFLGSSGNGWRRVADDLLPMSDNGSILPRFPQLKLAGDRQWSGAASLPLAAICLPRLGGGLDGAEPSSAPRLEPLPKVEVASRLIRHTVASRLFPPALLARHLVACTALAKAIPAFWLDLPVGIERLGESEELLRALLASLPPRTLPTIGAEIH